MSQPNIIKFLEVTKWHAILPWATPIELRCLRTWCLWKYERKRHWSQIPPDRGCCAVLTVELYCSERLEGRKPALGAEVNIKMADFGFNNKFTFDKNLATFCGSTPFIFAAVTPLLRQNCCSIKIWWAWQVEPGSPVVYTGQLSPAFWWTQPQEAMEAGTEDHRDLHTKFLIPSLTTSGQIIMDGCGSWRWWIRSYVDTLSDYKDPLWTNLVVSMCYNGKRSQPCWWVGQRDNKIKGHSAPGIQELKAEGQHHHLETSLQLGWPIAPSYKVQHSRSTNPKQECLLQHSGGPWCSYPQPVLYEDSE